MDSSLREILKDRVKHPILGGFIFSFLVINFDVIYMLLMNSIVYNNPQESLNQFKCSFKLNYFYRIFLPFFIGLVLAVFMPFVDSLYKSIVIYASSLRERWSKRASHLDYTILIRDLEKDVRDKNEKIGRVEHNIDSFIGSMISSINKNVESEDFFYEFRECSNIVKIGDLVSVSNEQYIVKLNKDLRKSFCGTVIWTNSRIAMIKRFKYIEKIYYSGIFINEIDPHDFWKNNIHEIKDSFYFFIDLNTKEVFLNISNEETNDKIILGKFVVNESRKLIFVPLVESIPQYKYSSSFRVSRYFLLTPL